MRKEKAYLDYSATTPMYKEVEIAMKPFWGKIFGNPSSIHGFGREALNALDEARGRVANVLHCSPLEVIFTASGTEADNLALFGVAQKYKKGHVVTSAIEHKAVLASCRELERQGYRVTYIRPNSEGIVEAEQVMAAIQDDTVLVSIMYVNNEIGTIQPIREIGKLINTLNKERAQKIVFHTDAIQAANLLSLDTQHLYVDLLSLSAHKVGGPKGVGCLFVKKNTDLHPIIFGGDQERGVRSGTQNVAGIVGFATALELAQKNSAKETGRLAKLQEYLLKELGKLPVQINGSVKDRVASNINFSIPGKSSDEIVIYCDLNGIAVSAASACSSGSIEPSHVIDALGLEPDRATSSVRVSMGYETTKAELTAFVKAIRQLA